MLLTYLKKVGWKRIHMTIVGNILIGLGIGIFRFAAMGNDPYTAMNLSLSSWTGIEYPVFQILFNLGAFVIQWVWGRELIGVGTVVNAFFLGYIVDLFYKVLNAFVPGPVGILQCIPVVFVGVIVCSFGLSLYQTSDVGVAPYDALSLITQKKLPQIPYFWHRMFDDGLAALISFVVTGFTNIGIGSLISAFGFGPFIHFFNHKFSEKILKNMSK